MMASSVATLAPTEGTDHLELGAPGREEPHEAVAAGTDSCPHALTLPCLTLMRAAYLVVG